MTSGEPPEPRASPEPPTPPVRRAPRWGLPLLAAGAAAVLTAKLLWPYPGPSAPPPAPSPQAPAVLSFSAKARPAPVLDAVARIPVDACAEARTALVAAAAARDPGGAAYVRFRRAVARAEPFFRVHGPAGEVLAGGGPADEDGGSLGRLDLALAQGDRAAIEQQVAEVSGALMLLSEALSRSPVRPRDLPDLLPRAAFWAGAALAGSKPGLSRSLPAAAADALGLLEAIHAALRATPGPASEALAAAAREAERLIEQLRAALEPALATGEVHDRATLVRLTGWVGERLRAALRPLGAPWIPYPPREPVAGDSDAEVITVLTVPSLRRWALPAGEGERLAALGERLFFDRTLSAGGARSCATCHVPEKAYSDGKPRPASLIPGTPIERNTPGLLYAPLHAAQLWDGRALTSERQALGVMHSKAEMGVDDSTFPRPGVASVKEAAAALAAFQIARLIPASAPIDRFARGEEQALSAEDRAGFDVFAGKGRCARCHVPPLFGGSHPPDFATAVYSVLGVPEDPSGKALDGDRGRAGVTRREVDVGAFKTPALRNVAKTAPYFHHGAFPSLEGVIDFYDKGGGKGLGLEVPGQDPDVLPLRLTEGEKRALLRFLRSALSDGPSPG